MAQGDQSNKVSEDQKAELSKRRGQAAAQISDPEEKRKFIAAQGNSEAKGTIDQKYSQLSTESALKGYKHGTDRVPQTGPAMLHKDEAVLNKDDADKYRKSKSIYDLAENKMAGKHEEKPHKEIAHIKTRKLKSGGYLHEHHHTHPEHHPMEEHGSANQDEMVGHMLDHMGTPNPGEADADAGQSGVPQPNAAPPAAVAAPPTGE